MLNSEQIKELGRRIREQFDPERIVLFGSYAAGAEDEESDVDLLVVAEIPGEPWKRYSAVRRVLKDFPVAFDIVVKTPDEYRRLRNVVNTIVYFADRYGRVLYERPDTPGDKAMAG